MATKAAAGKAAGAKGGAKKSGTDVATTKAAGAVSTLDFASDAGAGTEGVDAASQAIPFLTMLQGLSPQVAEGMDGAKPGRLVNTITNEFFDEVLVIPCSFRRRYLAWVPRDEGGGFRGEFSPIDVEGGNVEGMEERVDEEKKRASKWIGDAELKDTRMHFVLYQSANGTWNSALMSLGSTQIKKSKKWMSMILGIELKDGKGKPYNPASFSHVYKITKTKEQESNDAGKWWGYDISLVGPVTDAEVYAKAKSLHASVTGGSVIVDHNQNADAAASPEDDGKAPF